MIPDEAVKVDASESPNDPDIPRNASDVSCVKEDRKEGEREREVELGEEIYGRSTRTHEHRGENHRRTKVTNFYQKTSCFFSITISVL